MAYTFTLGGSGTRPTQPTHVAPLAYVSIVDNTPRFTFQVPTDPQSDSVVFAVEIDTVNTFNSADLLTIESRLSDNPDKGGFWQYDSDGAGTFLTMPSAGISTVSPPTGFAGRDVRATFPETITVCQTDYFWRVLVSDNMGSSCLLNQFNVLQCVLS